MRVYSLIKVFSETKIFYTYKNARKIILPRKQIEVISDSAQNQTFRFKLCDKLKRGARKNIWKKIQVFIGSRIFLRKRWELKFQLVGILKINHTKEEFINWKFNINLLNFHRNHRILKLIFYHRNVLIHHSWKMPLITKFLRNRAKNPYL